MKIIASLFSILAFSTMASASFNQRILCHSDDGGRVIARVKPGIPVVEIYKPGSAAPEYVLGQCGFLTGNGWVQCSEPGGRSFVLNKDLSGVYYGSNRTAYFSQCTAAGGTGD